jgi:hypothetical protein
VGNGGIAISATALKNRVAMLPDTNLKNKFVNGRGFLIVAWCEITPPQ